MTKTSTSIIVLAALADATTGVPYANFDRNQKAAVRRLEKAGKVVREGSLVIMTDAVTTQEWAKVEAYQAELDAAEQTELEQLAAERDAAERAAAAANAKKAKEEAKAAKKAARQAAKKAKQAAKPTGGYPASTEPQVCSRSTCHAGGTPQAPTEFYRDKSRPTGLDCWCKTCTKAHYAAKRAAKKAELVRTVR